VILAVDVGNTQTVLGLLAGDDIVGHWRVSTDAALTADELRVKVEGLLALDGHALAGVERVVVSSVVPPLTLAWDELAERATGRRPMTVGPGLKTGLPIRYDNPGEVGADRIVNAIAAITAFGAPVIVVDFGTATTLDVVDATGAYVGGVIAPGVETSAEALFSRAARLAEVDLEPPAKVIGTNTRAAIQSGLMLGEAVMIDGLVARIREELGEPEATVVATGGLAPTMAPLCAVIEHVDVDLTLRGLAQLYARNA
jgi:type III pantothenate kinase